MQRLRRTVHSHAEGAVAVGQGVPERRGTAMRAGGISRPLQPALDRPAPGLPHARPSPPTAPRAGSCGMNTLNPVSKKSGAKHRHRILRSRYFLQLAILYFSPAMADFPET